MAEASGPSPPTPLQRAGEGSFALAVLRALLAADDRGMTISSDERWLADARARAAAGRWEREAETVFSELRRQAEARVASQPPEPRCPACPGHPSMRAFPRYELISSDPFLYCPVCYGFWAVGDALARGVADAGFVHPALEAVPAPRRCKKCFGHLKPDNVCAKCGEAPDLLPCPLCSKPMERFERESMQLDECAPCRGTWFDTGEIARVFKLEPVQGLAASTVDENAPDEVPPPWLLAASVLVRMFLPFL